MIVFGTDPSYDIKVLNTFKMNHKNSKNIIADIEKQIDDNSKLLEENKDTMDKC